MGDMYLDSGSPYNQIDVWRSSTNTYSSSISLNIGQQCYGLFIDTDNSLYCSSIQSHQVVKRSLDSNNAQVIQVAGTGCSGFLSNMLQNPRGIFVDTNFDLYVADRENDRVQLFRAGQSNAITAAGRGAPATISLRLPSGVALDGDGYLFIADSHNDRIIGSGPDGFRCVIRCIGTWGPGSDQLASPMSIAFDSYGNIFTTDRDNNRVQYFQLLSNSCSE